MIKRGEIWEVRFDPSEGDEIRKIRPAVVMTNPLAGKMQLQIVVPITGWKPGFVRYFWMLHLFPNPINGLAKESAADAFQVKSLSTNPFQHRIGELLSDEIEEIATSIALCVGYPP
jgi:mRNA interferase MazF